VTPLILKWTKMLRIMEAHWRTSKFQKFKRQSRLWLCLSNEIAAFLLQDQVDDICW